MQRDKLQELGFGQRLYAATIELDREPNSQFQTRMAELKIDGADERARCIIRQFATSRELEILFKFFGTERPLEPIAYEHGISLDNARIIVHRFYVFIQRPATFAYLRGDYPPLPKERTLDSIGASHIIELGLDKRTYSRLLEGEYDRIGKIVRDIDTLHEHVTGIGPCAIRAIVSSLQRFDANFPDSLEKRAKVGPNRGQRLLVELSGLNSHRTYPSPDQLNIVMPDNFDQRVERVLRVLPTKNQEALRRYLDGESLHSIAKDCQCTTEAVRCRKNRALELIKERGLDQYLV